MPAGEAWKAHPGARPPFLSKGERSLNRPLWVDYPDGAITGRRGTNGSGDEPEVFFIGIIDILTAWTCLKSAENVFKTLAHPWSPNAHSCVPPGRYADRFESSLRKWIG